MMEGPSHWIAVAEDQKIKIGKEHMVVQWGPNHYNVHTTTMRVPDYAQVVYRTDEAQRTTWGEVKEEE